MTKEKKDSYVTQTVEKSLQSVRQVSVQQNREVLQRRR